MIRRFQRIVFVGGVVFVLGQSASTRGQSIVGRPGLSRNASSVGTAGTIWSQEGLGVVTPNTLSRDVQHLPVGYFSDASSSVDATQRDRRLESADQVRENWLVVALLGLSFTVGLSLTITMIRRATVTQPTRLFGQ